MNLRTQLTGRIHLDNIREILHHTQESEQLREELYQLILMRTKQSLIKPCGCALIFQRRTSSGSAKSRRI